MENEEPLEYLIDCVEDEIANYRKDIKEAIFDLTELQRGLSMAEDRLEGLKYDFEQETSG